MTPWPACARPANQAYWMLCEELLAIRPVPRLPVWCGGAYDVLSQMNDRNLGTVVNAALAAADCARAAEEHVADPAGHPAWVREYRDVVGGGRGQGDIVTAWIQDRLHAIHATFLN